MPPILDRTPESSYITRPTRRSPMYRSLLAITLLMIFCFCAAGQTATGIIQGRVSDTTGAPIPSAKVVVENQNTGLRYELQTNSEGFYYQPFLIPGPYRVNVEKSGFQKFLATDNRVDVQQTINVDIALKVGE